MSMVFCRDCGKEIHETNPTCPHCGAPQNLSHDQRKNLSMVNKDSEGGLWFYYLKVLKNYAVFNGRARRKEFWLFLLGHSIVFSLLFFLFRSTTISDQGFNVIESIYIIATSIPYTAVCVRRLHDTNRSGWWLLLPIINLFFFCIEGQEAENRFGPNPKLPHNVNDAIKPHSLFKQVRAQTKNIKEEAFWYYYFEALKKYADFKGRARRKEYWMLHLCNFVVLFIIAFLGVKFSADADLDSAFAIVCRLYFIAMLIPLTSAGVRRLHDTDRSGWWLLLPIINLSFLVEEGDLNENKFGANPKPIMNTQTESIHTHLKQNINKNTLSFIGIFDGIIDGIFDLIIKIISKKYIILVFGILGLIMGFFMDTSVSSGIGRVNNIGLMQEQQNILFISGIAVLIGFYLAKVKK